MHTATSHMPEPLKVWDKLTLVVGEGNESGVYMARIEDIINGGIIITEPEFIRGKSLLRENLDIIVQVTRPDAVYQFSTRVRRLKSGRRGAVVLTPPRRYRRVQRRMFVRIEVCHRVEYAVVPSEFTWEEWERRLRWYESRTFDLSAGGVLVQMEPGSLSIADVVVLRMRWLEKAGLPAALLATCRRVSRRDDTPVAGLQFILADELEDYLPGTSGLLIPTTLRAFTVHAQNDLSRYVFNEQIELRRKGLL